MNIASVRDFIDLELHFTAFTCHLYIRLNLLQYKSHEVSYNNNFFL